MPPERPHGLILTLVRAALAHLRRVFSRSPWAAECASAMTLMTWAVYCWAGPNDMEIWPSAVMMMQLGTDEAWQMVGFSLGFWQLMFLGLDRRWTRWMMALACCWFWALLALSVWVATPWNPHVPAYGGYILINLFSILRLLRPER